jgi:aryl-alcohol dehydrogenase-like predicted oxidoreductase
MDAARELGFGLIPYQPLAAGVLTGKYQRGAEPPAGTRAGDVSRFRRDVTDQRVAAVERLKPWAAGHDRSVAELGIAWLLAHPEVSTIVAGARTPLQLDHNVRAADWTLTVADRDEARQIVLGRPDGGLD